MPKQQPPNMTISCLTAADIVSKEMMELLLLADPDQSAVDGYMPGINTLVVYKELELIAIAVLVMDGNEFELKNIAVKESYQGLGIAKKLIAEVKASAKSLGATRLWVGTGNSSLSQLALYQKSGFRFQSVKKGYFVNYDPPIVENGIHCIDMLMLVAEL